MLGTAPVMPDALELLKGRRSTRVLDLAEPGPSDAQIDQILTIAARVPDHGKLVPWRFVVLVGEGRKRMADTLALRLRAAVPPVAEDQIEKERSRFANSPVIVALVSRAGPHPKIPEWEQVLSAGAVGMNLLHAANAIGFGAVWLTGPFAYDRGAMEALGLAPHERIVGFVHIGTPLQPQEERPRPALSDIVTRI
jgi:nitroreductase